VTVFCLESPSAKERESLEYPIRTLSLDGFPYQHHFQLNKALKKITPEIEKYDLVHSYILSTIPAMQHFGKHTTTATVTTLNSYGGACPKGNALYMNREACSTNGTLRCLRCALSTIPDHDTFRDNIYNVSNRLTNLKLIQSAYSDLEKIDAYHALSPHLRSRYIDFGFPVQRLNVIPNILDENFLVEHTSDFEEPYRLIHVGYLHRQKGVDRLPALIEELHSEAPGKYELTIAGDGRLFDELSADIKHRGLTDVVDLLGHVDNTELPELLAEHDIFVYPGRWDEPFGRVYLESMAAGTPVVSTDIGSARVILGNGGVVTEESVSGLKNGILDVSDRDQLESMSKSAIEKAKSYRASDVFPKFEKLYNRVC